MFEHTPEYPGEFDVPYAELVLACRPERLSRDLRMPVYAVDGLVVPESGERTATGNDQGIAVTGVLLDYEDLDDGLGPVEVLTQRQHIITPGRGLLEPDRSLEYFLSDFVERCEFEAPPATAAHAEIEAQLEATFAGDVGPFAGRRLPDVALVVAGQPLRALQRQLGDLIGLSCAPSPDVRVELLYDGARRPQPELILVPPA